MGKPWKLYRLLCVISLFLVVLPSIVKCTDPCAIKHPPVVPDLMRRRPSSRTGSGTPGLDDGSISHAWYTAIGLKIITNRVAQNSCGSNNAIWATGDVPQVVSSTTNLVMEYYNATKSAYETFGMSATFCGDYTMYNLIPVPGRSYCFDFPSSSDEKIPEYVPENIRISPGLEFNSVSGTNWPQLLFECEFSRAENLTYVVIFHANDVPLANIMQVDSEPTSKAIIKENILSDLGIKQGVTMSCSVGVRNTSTSPVAEIYKSPGYFAGIKIDATSVVLSRGQMVEMEVQPTVPFGCHSGRVHCNIELTVLSKENTDVDNCIASRIVSEGINRCGVIITGKKYLDENWIQSGKWGEKLKLRLKHIIEQDALYELDKSEFNMEVRISTSDHSFWSNPTISNIKVRVKDDNDLWKGKKTGGHCDPHMQTFDGIPYELHFPGRFIAYSHKTLPIKVHVEITACFGDDKSPYCVCGIAIVAGQDVFLLYTCGDYKIIDYTVCEEHVLKVVRFDSKYEIYLPTGTKVVASLVQLDVVLWDYDIYPSISDVNSTSGLSGSLDGDCSNDFQLRHGCQEESTTEGAKKTCEDTTRSYSFTPDDFSASFELGESEDLFPPYKKKAYKALKPYKTEEQHCYCQYKEGNVTTFCLPTHYWPCNETSREVKCLISSNPFADPKSNSTGSLTEADARAKCEEVIKTSETFKKCRSLNIDEADNAVETCIFDVMATGDLMWADFALDRTNEACLQTIKKNSTLRQEQADLAVEIERITCPRGCSRNGACINGTCDCFKPFVGYDCSTNATGAPKVDGIARGKFCDEGSGCEGFYIQGPKFIENQPYVCRYKSKKIKPDGTRCCEETKTRPAEGRTTFEIKCPLPEKVKDKDGFATEYSVSVATADGEFSESVVGYSYDSTCQTFNDRTDSVTFELKEKYCFIDGECIEDGKRSTRACFYCDYDKEPLEWTTFSNKSECRVADSKASEDDNTAVVAGAIAGAVAAVAALSTAVAVVVKKVVIGSALSQAASLQAAGGIAFPTPNSGLGPAKATFSGI